MSCNTRTNTRSNAALSQCTMLYTHHNYMHMQPIIRVRHTSKFWTIIPRISHSTSLLCSSSIGNWYMLYPLRNLPPPHQSNWVHQSYNSPFQSAGSYSLSIYIHVYICRRPCFVNLNFADGHVLSILILQTAMFCQS